MYVESVPNRNSPPAVLLRESRREDGKIVKRTLANLTDWPAAKIESLRRLLGDELLVDPHALLQTHQTLPHGHVAAVLMTMQRLGLESILGSQPGWEAGPGHGHDCGAGTPSLFEIDDSSRLAHHHSGRAIISSRCHRE
jgi:hypothetical protein